MRKTRFVFTLLALRVLATSVMQIAAQAQGGMPHLDNDIYDKNKRGLNVINELRR
jgi:hypothetical protein